MKISCDFRWEMGHRLPEHAGGCKNVHGHSYKMRVEIEGEVQPNGMVMDFADLKKIVQPLVDAWDHCFLCDESDGLMKRFLLESKFSVQFVPFATTAENIAKYFISRIRSKMMARSHLSRITVRVYETQAAYAEASAEIDNGAIA